MEQYDKSYEEVPLTGILYEFREALKEEIKYISKNGLSSTLLRAGRRLSQNGSDYRYSFKIEYAPTIPADTPCKLIIEKNSYNVTVIGFDDNEIIIASPTELPGNMASARLENGATILMELLIKRIEDSSTKYNPAGKRLLPDVPGADNYSVIEESEPILEDSLNQAQKDAVRSAMTRDITYIWGPPGTGKTQVIGNIIWNLYKAGRKVLIVSHTNIAVDGAIEKAVYKRDDSGKIIKDSNGEKEILLRQDDSCPVLRIGYPQKSIPSEALMSSHVKLLGEELYSRQETLQREQREKSQELSGLTEILTIFIWNDTNSITEMVMLADDVSHMSGSITRLEKELYTADQEIKRYKAEHPEALQYDNLLKRKKTLESELENNKEQGAVLETSISDCSTLIETAKEELSKHRVYSSLSVELSRMMPEGFLNSKRIELQNQISALVGEANSLSQRVTELDTYIAQAKQSSFTMFFSKKRVSDAETEAQKNRDRISQIYEQLTVLNHTKEEYDKQIIAVRSLQERQKDVHPSQTVEYWKNTQQKKERELERLLAQKDECSRKIATIRNEIKLCTADLESLSGIYEEYNRIARHHAELIVATRHARITIEEKENKLNQLIKKENDNAGGLINEPEEDVSLLDRVYSIKQCFEESINKLEGQDRTEVESSVKRIKDELSAINQELNEIAQQIGELEKTAIQNADIVGATLAKSYISDVLQEMEFDTLILDEASMASIPALWCACYLAKRNVVIVGDFLQLPPIVLSKGDLPDRWLKRDIFKASGVQDRIKNHCPDNFIMLNEQYRMESDIADLANIYYGEYGGIKSHDNLQERVIGRDEFYQWFPGVRGNGGIEIIDTANLHAWVTSVPQGKNHSRLNYFSAALSVEMAFTCVTRYLQKHEGETTDETKVLIIAPYKPHIDRVRQLIELKYEQYGIDKDSGLIKAGTIHSFQGNEADIVIFDLVVDQPHFRANLFMNDHDTNENLKKMFNVAVTRAKFKLFVVGNIEYCRKLAKGNALGVLLGKIKDCHGYDAKELFPRLTITLPTTIMGNNIGKDGDYLICQEAEFFDYLRDDIRKLKQRLVIFSPFITSNRLSELLPEFHDAIGQGKQIIVITKDTSDRGKREQPVYSRLEAELRAIGIDVLHKKGMHEKIVIIDDSAIWFGSLNSLSFAGNTGEIMIKVCDKKLTLETEKMYDIPHIQTAIDSEYELTCPLCGKPMILGESNKGGLYWNCSECDYGRGMEQQYPKEGVLRCGECGGNLIFSMKNQPRWVCELNPKHYQKMRYGDLRLEKMAALIPNKDRAAVDRYFADKQKEKEEKKANKGNPISAPSVHTTDSAAYGKRAVIQMDDNGNVIAQYDSVSLASAVVGVNNKSIREAANGIQRHAGGFVWKWA